MSTYSYVTPASVVRPYFLYLLRRRCHPFACNTENQTVYTIRLTKAYYKYGYIFRLYIQSMVKPNMKK
jgi:hypothetical protein